MAYDYRSVLCSTVNGVLTITLNRPEAINALNRDLEEALHAALDEGDVDPDVRVMVITGSGRGFSAGYDMAGGPGQKSRLDPSGFASVSDFIASNARLDYQNMQRAQLHVLRLNKPVIAAVHGYCMGGGMWLAMACDMTYCAEDAVFGQPEVRHGSNSTFLIPALCGWKHASRYLLTGDHLDGKEAARIGLVNECLPGEKLMPTVQHVAERVAKVPPDSVRHMKRLIMSGFLAYGLSDAMELCAAMSALLHTSHGPERQAMFDAQAERGFRGFLEVRDGPFFPEAMGPKSRGGR